jgi:hypothetical protein
MSHDAATEVEAQTGQRSEGARDFRRAKGVLFGAADERRVRSVASDDDATDVDSEAGFWSARGEHG